MAGSYYPSEYARLSLVGMAGTYCAISRPAIAPRLGLVGGRGQVAWRRMCPSEVSRRTSARRRRPEAGRPFGRLGGRSDLEDLGL